MLDDRTPEGPHGGRHFRSRKLLRREKHAQGKKKGEAAI
jgi:hypothetical protein